METIISTVSPPDNSPIYFSACTDNVVLPNFCRFSHKIAPDGLLLKTFAMFNVTYLTSSLVSSAIYDVSDVI